MTLALTRSLCRRLRTERTVKLLQVMLRNLLRFRVFLCSQCVWLAVFNSNSMSECLCCVNVICCSLTSFSLWARAEIHSHLLPVFHVVSGACKACRRCLHMWYVQCLFAGILWLSMFCILRLLQNALLYNLGSGRSARLITPPVLRPHQIGPLAPPWRRGSLYE